jgi:hypothetical protein
MESRNRREVVFATILGALSLALSWLLFGESSPLKQSFLPRTVPFSELWAGLHLHFYVLLRAIGASEYWGGLLLYVFVFTQWFLIGLAIGRVARKRFT